MYKIYVLLDFAPAFRMFVVEIVNDKVYTTCTNRRIWFHEFTNMNDIPKQLYLKIYIYFLLVLHIYIYSVVVLFTNKKI